MPGMTTDTSQLKAEIEAAANALGIAPSTLGERAGQGGHFYRRLCAGKRVWPETADKVRAFIAAQSAHGAEPDAGQAEGQDIPTPAGDAA